METDSLAEVKPRGFEELLDLERSRDLLMRGTGRGVRVAIVDTGVEAAHPALEGSVKSCHEVVRTQRGLVCQESDELDLVGHGTACAGIIHEIAPEAELHSVRVIGQGAAGTGEQFLHGLGWVIEEGFDVVNLSLGTIQERFRRPLHELVDKAHCDGMILVAAANNRPGVKSFPSEFASLVSVDNQSFEEPLRFNYHLRRTIEMDARGIYVRAPAPGGKFQLYTGTSFACPHITGIAARLRSEIPSLTPFQVKTLLWALRSNTADA